MNKLFAFVFSFVLIATMAMPSFSAGKAKKTEVINDEWEEGWETSFFEKESEKKQILKKDKEKTVVVPRETRRKPVQNEDDSIRLPSKEELEAREQQRQASGDDAYYDKLISASERNAAISAAANPITSSILPEKALYVSLGYARGSMIFEDGEYGDFPIFAGNAFELSLGLKKGVLKSEFDFMYTLDRFPYQYADFKAITMLLNFYADLNITGSPSVIPYIGLGIGATDLDPSDEQLWMMAWQASLGITYAFSKHIAADIGVRYLYYGDFTDDDDAFDVYCALHSTQFKFALKYFF